LSNKKSKIYYFKGKSAEHPDWTGKRNSKELTRDLSNPEGPQ
jgi:hypothetical protein